MVSQIHKNNMRGGILAVSCWQGSQSACQKFPFLTSFFYDAGSCREKERFCNIFLKGLKTEIIFVYQIQALNGVRLCWENW
jgi:hypothetical protein